MKYKTQKFLKRINMTKDSAGNALIMGIVAITIMSVFGLTLVSRMVLDSNITALRLGSTKAFYLADSGIQMGRRYLWLGNTAATTMGPFALGDGSFTMEIERTQERLWGSSWWDREDIYRIRGTATVGNTTRVIEEIRMRGGGSDLDFVLWREEIVNETQ